MIKIEIKSISGKVLFVYENENATIKKAIEQAIKEKINLRSADLRSADLSSAKNKETAYLPIYCKWSSSIKGDKIKIGCKEKTIEDWDIFFNSKEEFDTKRDTVTFKQIQAVYESFKAYYLFLNS